MHPYFSDVSLVSLYISSVAAAWRIRLLLKHVCVADPLTGVVRHNRLSRVGQREPRQHLRHFSSASQIIHKHLKVHRPSHEPHLRVTHCVQRWRLSHFTVCVSRCIPNVPTDGTFRCQRPVITSPDTCTQVDLELVKGMFIESLGKAKTFQNVLAVQLVAACSIMQRAFVELCRVFKH